MRFRCRYGPGWAYPRLELRYDLWDETDGKGARHRRLVSRSSGVPDRVTERDKAAGHWASFLLHLYPVKVRRVELTFKYSAFLGVARSCCSGRFS